MKKYYPITENPDGYTSNFFIHTSFNPQTELKNLDVKLFVIKKILNKQEEYAGIILGEINELTEIQKRMSHNNWEKII